MQAKQNKHSNWVSYFSLLVQHMASETQLTVIDHCIKVRSHTPSQEKMIELLKEIESVQACRRVTLVTLMSANAVEPTTRGSASLIAAGCEIRRYRRLSCSGCKKRRASHSAPRSVACIPRSKAVVGVLVCRVVIVCRLLSQTPDSRVDSPSRGS